MLRETWSAPSFNGGYHVMIGVIGTSFTAEYVFKGLYETTVGALTAWWVSDDVWKADTKEDRFIQDVAQDYSAFIHTTPWYEYPFGSKLIQLWNLPGPAEGSWIRRWERRFEFTLELLFKMTWSWVIKQGTAAGYDPEAETIQAWVKQGTSDLATIDPAIKVLDRLDERSVLVSLPRYEPFKRAVATLISQGAHLVEVAGNDQILMTILAPQNWRDAAHQGVKVCEWTILTEPSKKRVALLMPIGRLHETLPALEREGVTLDHLYDF
jgi:hypothetical protein